MWSDCKAEKLNCLEGFGLERFLVERYFKWSESVRLLHFLFNIFPIPIGVETQAELKWPFTQLWCFPSSQSGYLSETAHRHSFGPPQIPQELSLWFYPPFCFLPSSLFSFLLLLYHLSHEPIPIPTSPVPHTRASVSSSTPITDSSLAASLFFLRWVSSLSTQTQITKAITRHVSYGIYCFSLFLFIFSFHPLLMHSQQAIPPTPHLLYNIW